MPTTTISALPAGTAASTWKAPADDAVGSGTYYVTLGAIAFLMNDASNLTVGTIPDARLSANVVLTGDARLTNARTPSAHAGSHATGGTDAITPTSIGAANASHAHGNITAAGAIGSTAGLPLVTQASGVVNVGAFGSTSGTFCAGDDARLSNSRAPTTHASSHQPDGSDPVLPRSVTLNLSGTNNNLSVSGYDVVRVTSAGNVTITGITASPAVPVLIVNENGVGGGTVTLAHESSLSTATNRIRNQSLADVTIQPDGGTALLVLSPVVNRWRT